MLLAPPVRPLWHTARGELRLDRAAVVGVLNLTPDSFWSGSRAAGVDAGLARAGRMLEDGASLLDVGGESTRPGAAAITADAEIERVVPVVRAIARAFPDARISVDTTKRVVARAALEAGAAAINDVSALRLDPELAHVVASHDAGLVLMHSRGTVETMASYALAAYGPDPVAEIVAELRAALDAARAAGVADECIVLDPGLGFAKRTEHSVAALAQLDRILTLGRPVMIGPSRKRFIGELTRGLPVEQRLEGTIAACVAGYLRGARLFRVHDVAPVRRALDIAEAVSGTDRERKREGERETDREGERADYTGRAGRVP